MNLTKSFNNGLGKWMRKAARPSGGVDSLNPHRWRGERLHHHGGGVCWLFVLLWMDSWHHKLIVCKIWYKNYLKMRLTALLFDPPTREPYREEIATPPAWRTSPRRGTEMISSNPLQTDRIRNWEWYLLCSLCSQSKCQSSSTKSSFVHCWPHCQTST